MAWDTDASAVSDPNLQLRGIERLRVIDASAMPTITSNNTNSPTLMIAWADCTSHVQARVGPVNDCCGGQR